jgi:pSer/pThr/pTyr-binding forkhead associated (FHA) protein
MEVPDAGASPQRHRLLWGHQEIGLSEGENVIGRMPDAPVWIGHSSVSRRHARILITGDRAEIEDLESKNGTWKSGAKVTGRISLSDGDEVRVGRVRLIYRNSVADPTAETETDASSASG